jgi:hypothetical protein
MRVSELAKELGYKAAELVELAKAKGIKVEDARANIDARLAAAVRAQVPHRSKLTANPALMDVYTRVVTEEAAKAAAKAAELGGGRALATTITRNFLGFPGQPQSYAITIVPPKR